MKPENRLEDIVKKDLNVRASDGTYARMRRAVLDAHGRAQTNAAAATPTITGRMLMRHSIVKLAIAAAIIAVVGLGMFEFIGTGSKSGVVWAEVVRKVQASRGVIFRTTEHIVPDTYNMGVDFTMHHWSSTQSRLDGYKGGALIKTIWSDCNTKTTTLVDYDHKSYVKMTAEEMPDRFGMADPNSTIQRFLSCQHKELGRKTIAGTLCEGMETADPAFYGGGDSPEPPMARVWVSVETGYPVQFEGERVWDDRTRHTFVQDQFQWDVELDGSLFEPNIPAGYLDISPY